MQFKILARKIFLVVARAVTARNVQKNGNIVTANNLWKIDIIIQRKRLIGF